MSQIINNKKVFSLLEVTHSIQKTITERYKSSFWIKAEMNKLNHYSHSGHCYPDLVEKNDGKVIAQMRSILWKSDFVRINETFLGVLKEPIKDGINILFCASISFDPSHGLSLRILDIDPSFSLGELEREKQETIERLNKEGLFNNNKNLKFPLLPQRIAVISVETSKGYSDYLKIIEANPWNYKFFNFLFPSLLQGDKSIAAIINQLRRIKKVTEHFDVVAIIRGGGGDVGLSSYNNYELAKEIAVFPIPVITGIGHSTNSTVVEMVSFQNAITPTELADFLIQKFHNFSVPVKKAEEIITERSRRIIGEEKLKFRNAIRYFQSVTTNRLLKSSNEIHSHTKTLIQQSKFLIKRENQLFDMVTKNIQKQTSAFFMENNQQVADLTKKFRKQVTLFVDNQKRMLQNLEKNVAILNPINILRRGFSITLKNGKAIGQGSEVRVGDTITTMLAKGEIESSVLRSGKLNDV